MLQVAWLIPLLPFIAFWAILFRGRRLPGEGAYVAIGALGLPGLLSLVILGQVMFGGRYQATMVWATMRSEERRAGKQGQAEVAPEPYKNHRLVHAVARHDLLRYHSLMQAGGPASAR